MLSSGVSLVLACVGFIIYDISMLKKRLIEETSSRCKVLASMNTATLKFDDQKTARETTVNLGEDTHVLAAVVYDSRGVPFATYARKDRRQFTPPTPRQDYSITSEHIDVFQPIMLDQERIGTALVRTDVEPLNEAISKYLSIGTGVLLFSGLTAFLISMQLQKVISRPLLDLSRMAQQVSATKDYSLRASKQSEDEIGQLIDAFNEMLRQLQTRDAELNKARDTLEIRVQERTRELELEIAERARVEDSLRAFTRKLEVSNRELQDFAYVASHDLQEPLRKVQAFADRLKLKYGQPLGAEGTDLLSRMQNAGSRMQALINDLLAFSRVTTKANPFQEVDLTQVVREVVSDLEVRVQQTKGKVECGPLPTVQADAMQMRQLFQNLIGNALKFHTENQPPLVRVTGQVIAVQGQPPLCELQVADNGIGFDEKYLDRIFTVFQRLHGRGVYEGTGIGLAICRKIVDRHGGMITAKSKPGAGATFIVRLPVQQKAELS